MEPKLLDALTMLLGNRPRYSVPHAASIMRVDPARIYAALAALEAANLVEVSDRGEPQEAWHSTSGDGALPPLLERVEQLQREGHLAAGVLETPLG